jgi:hypothetical protein
MKGLTIQIIPYYEIENLTPIGRIRKLLNIAKENKIVLLQGRLSPDEEKELIRTTMEEINKEFKGIELATLDTQGKSGKIRQFLTNLLIGNKQGITIIGPANIVKEIKKDPSKIELLTEVKKR